VSSAATSSFSLSNELTPDWARSFLGYPPVKAAQPNPLHIYLASLQALGLSHGLLTQNVDNLHRKALLRLQAVFGEHGARASASRILELHGTLAKVHCLQNGHEGTRDEWQKMLGDLNPIWDQEARDMVAEGR
jgi:NAD-dependent SIR2 family protein deacetylase